MATEREYDLRDFGNYIGKEEDPYIKQPPSHSFDPAVYKSISDIVYGGETNTRSYIQCGNCYNYLLKESPEYDYDRNLCNACIAHFATLLTCRNCYRVQPKSNFYIEPARSRGYTSKCKECLAMKNRLQRLYAKKEGAPIKSIKYNHDRPRTKRCNKCDEVKSGDLFTKDPYNKSGVRASCKACEKISKADKRKIWKAKELKKRREKRDAIKDRILKQRAEVAENAKIRSEQPPKKRFSLDEFLQEPESQMGQTSGIPQQGYQEHAPHT